MRKFKKHLGEKRPQTQQCAARAARFRIVQSLEKMHPSMVVFSGPFDIQSPDEVLREREIEQCTKMKAEFQTACVPVKVVLTKVGAYLLRAKDGTVNGASVQLENYRIKWQRCRSNKREARRA